MKLEVQGWGLVLRGKEGPRGARDTVVSTIPLSGKSSSQLMTHHWTCTQTGNCLWGQRVNILSHSKKTSTFGFGLEMAGDWDTEYLPATTLSSLENFTAHSSTHPPSLSRDIWWGCKEWKKKFFKIVNTSYSNAHHTKQLNQCHFFSPKGY